MGGDRCGVESEAAAEPPWGGKPSRFACRSNLIVDVTDGTLFSSEGHHGDAVAGEGGKQKHGDQGMTKVTFTGTCLNNGTGSTIQR